MARIVTGLRGPKHQVLGVDVAGVVDAEGEGVTRFSLGDRVFGIAPGGYGAHAQFVCMPAEGAVAHLPDRVGFTEAVVCEGVWYAMSALDRLGVQAGDRILVYGASGAIGIAAVQLAKARGAKVVAVVDGRSVDSMRSMGAPRTTSSTTRPRTTRVPQPTWISCSTRSARHAFAMRARC